MLRNMQKNPVFLTNTGFSFMAEKEGFENSIVTESTKKSVNSVFRLIISHIKAENILITVNGEKSLNEK